VDDWVNTDHCPLGRGVVVHVGKSLHGGAAGKVEGNLIIEGFHRDKINLKTLLTQSPIATFQGGPSCPCGIVCTYLKSNMCCCAF
jgi:hypothetical protein